MIGKGININCFYQDFIRQILDGNKTIETRNTPSLRPYIEKRIGIIRTGKGKAVLCGYATITEEIHYDSVESFRMDYNLHRVAPGSKYDICTEKYGYKLSDVVEIKPIPIDSRGIISRSIPTEVYLWKYHRKVFDVSEKF